MFSFIGFILIFIFIIIVFVLSIIGGVLRTIFGLGRRSSSRQTQYRRPAGDDTAESSRATSQTKAKKIFDKEEGEYVDFEEIKNEEE